jgi:hypothetical protein
MLWSVVFSLVGCSLADVERVAGMIPTYDGYDAQLQALHGRSINEVVDDWGVPDEKMELAGGHSAYVWTLEHAVTTPDRFEVRESANGNNIAGEIHRGEKVGVHCKTTLRTDPDGLVVSHKAEGAGCIGVDPDPASPTGSVEDDPKDEKDRSKSKAGLFKKRHK